MNSRVFYIGLIITVALTVVSLWGLYYSVPKSAHWTYTLILLPPMVLLAIRMYYASTKAAADPNPYLFTQKYLGFTGIKILTCIALSVIYKSVYPEANKTFLYSFLIIYLYFTIYETYVFMKLSKP